MRALKNASEPMSVHPPFVFKVFFDGGSSRDDAYGSFDIEFNGFKVRRHRMPFVSYNVNGFVVTNNVAEYLSLIAALKWLSRAKERKQYAVEIYGDSMLVICQINGTYKCHTEPLERMRDICRKHLEWFGDWRVYWHRRNNNVSRFGH